MSAEATDSTVLRDQDARDLIREDLERNVMVLAGAGAGKTHALVERMACSVRSGVADIDRMAAITFTRKAAGEMRGRFYMRLREERASATTPAETERLERAIQRIDQCFIGTIHSFCGRLLRERSLEAGLPPDFQEIEDREELLLRREAWDEFVQACYGASDARLDELEDHGIIPEDLYAFFGERCMNSDIPLKNTSTERPDLMPAAERVTEFIAAVEPYIPPRPEKRDKLMQAIRRARHLIDNHGVSSNRDAARLLLLFDGGLGVTLKHWSDRQAAKEIRDEWVATLKEETVAPALRLWRESAYRLVADFVNDAVEFYDRQRKELGKVTFQDLLLCTATLLSERPDVRRYFQGRYRTLLVDEFQDTDPIQAEILFYLTGTDAEERDWRRLTPRPGSLFLVGDDKQSIYRFRRADVEVFRLAADRIEQTGGSVVRLNTSFRSLGTLCKWISTAFPPAFSRWEAPYQAPFEPLFEHRARGVDPHCVRKVTIPKVNRNNRADISAKDAERIADFILAALEGRTSLNHGGDDGALPERASPGDFLILTRTTGCLRTYAEALERRGIPFDISGGGRLGDSEEVRAIVTMLRAVHEPDNPLPFLAYLRGPLAGFSDPDLYALKSAGARFAIDSKIPETLGAELRARFQNALEQLQKAESDFTGLTPAAAIESILERTGYLAYVSVHSRGGASSRAGNLLRLLSLVRRFSSQGWNWGRIVEEVHALVTDRDYKAEEMTLEMGREDVVRLMNLHQAKGLQAPVVFLADAGDTSYDREPNRHVSRSDDRSYLAMTVTRPRGDYHSDIVAQPAGWQEDKEEEKRYAAAEEIRLLYVAATRARNLLIVSQYTPKSDVGPWSPLYGFLKDVPELEIPDALSRPLPESRGRAYADEVAAARDRIEALRRSTYTEQTISGSTAETDVEFVVREGRGRDYGSVIHRLFEEAIRGLLPSPVDEYVCRCTRDAGLEEERADDALAALDRLKTSTLWQEVERADRVYTEVPLATAHEAGAVRGVIDLVYRIDGTWKIVDYKTDAAPTHSDVERLMLKYKRQIDQYAEYWSAITDEPVDRPEIWIVHGPPQTDQLTLF